MTKAKSRISMKEKTNKRCNFLTKWIKKAFMNTLPWQLIYLIERCTTFLIALWDGWRRRLVESRSNDRPTFRFRYEKVSLEVNVELPLRACALCILRLCPRLRHLLVTIKIFNKASSFPRSTVQYKYKLWQNRLASFQPAGIFLKQNPLTYLKTIRKNRNLQVDK